MRKNKFCETCGSPEASSSSSSLPPFPSTIPFVPNIVPAPNPSNSLSGPNLDPPLPYPLQSTTSKNKNAIAMITASSVALLLVIGVVINANRVTYTSIEVSMSIFDQDCWDLSWGYFDIPGAEVVLAMDGVDVAWAEYPTVGTDESMACTFTTNFYDVPMNGEMYEFSMSSGRRGTITKTRSELEADGWSLNLSLGL